jgi:HEAT repeat protein
MNYSAVFIAFSIISASGCQHPSPSTAPETTSRAPIQEPLTLEHKQDRSLEALERLLSRRHYTPTQADIERVSAQPTKDLQALALSEEGRSIVQLRAIYALALFPSDSSVKTLLTLFQSERPVVRRNSLATLARIDRSIVTKHAAALNPVAMQASRDVDMHVRLAAIEVMAAMPEGETLMRAALKNESDLGVRATLEKRLQEVAR